MSPPALILANHKNSLASTGPVSPEGKAIVSQNALKFGLTSQQVVLPHEDAADFEALHVGLLNRHRPANDAEHLCVDNGAVAEWRVRRIERTQHAWIQAEMKKHPADADVDVAWGAFLLSDQVRKFQKYAAAYRRERESAFKMLKELQKVRKAEEKQQAEADRYAELVQRNKERLLQIKADWEAENPGKTITEREVMALPRNRVSM